MLLFWVGLGLIHLPLVALVGLLLFVHWRVLTLYVPSGCPSGSVQVLLKVVAGPLTVW